MPELPEVETVRRGLEALVLGQEIVAVTLKVPKWLNRLRDVCPDPTWSNHSVSWPSGKIFIN